MIDMEKLRMMPESALRELNNAVVTILNEKLRRKTALAASAFAPGDHVCFYDRRNVRVVTMQVTRINAKTVSGFEVGRPSTTWRVSPSMLSHVTSQESVC